MLHEIGSVKSDDGAAATVTVAKELVGPTTGLGLSVKEVGACCGVSMSCVCTVWPFKVALSVTVVLLWTGLVGTFTMTD